jgi:hypothetical protein
MDYITQEITKNALNKMKLFHDDLTNIFSKHDMNILENSGRRNMLLSQAQEKFFAQELGKVWPNVEHDGRTGQPDIVIGSLGKELECKLTSPNKRGALQLQTDYDTLDKKESLDYLYVIADHGFNKFCVLHFNNLTIDDFFNPSPGSKGKARMIKHVAMDKCTVFYGKVVDKNVENIENLGKKYDKLTARAIKTKKKIEDQLEFWAYQPTQYRFELEEL